MQVAIRRDQPSLATVHVDSMLTNMSVAYIQSAAVFMATKIFPIVPVDKQSNKYYTFTKNDWFRDEARKRADSTESAGSGFTLSSDSYACDVWAFHKDIGYQTSANADAQVRLEEATVQFVTQRLMLRQEVQWASDYFTTGVWATDVTPTNLWSDFLNSDPVGDIETGRRAILASTGFKPNKLVIGYDVYMYLKQHPDLYDRIKYGTGAPVKLVTPQILAQIFEVDEVVVAEAIKATNVEGGTAAYSFVHGKHALLAYVNPTPQMMMPSAGYTFMWTGVSGSLGTTIAIDSFEIRAKKTMRYEGEVAYDNKVVASDLGYFFNGAVA